MADLREPQRRAPAFYAVEVTPSYYDVVQDGIDYYPVPATEHLPAEPKTFKDLEHNIVTLFRDVAVGDTIVFHCEKQKPGYTVDIEKKIARIQVNERQHMKLLYFVKEPVPAWKTRKV